ncbi:hypothetical protein V2J09_003787 [Rumex salicifolius]
MENQVLSKDQPLPPSLLAMRLNWDVFLSFRGGDTSDNFTSELYSALCRSGVRTFMNNDGRRGGDEIDTSLIEAIHDSAASIAVISPGYADSHRCLEELARLFECRKLVVPVFYRVNPSHVRKHSGPFGDAFRVLERKYSDERVGRWKRALNMAGERSGQVLAENSDESHAIKMIVERISTELSRIPIHVTAYPVGLDSRRDEVINKLNLQSNDVQFLGIHGHPGIGKTTLAKAVFSRLVASFKRRCFISNFKETLEKEGVLVIQKKLIFDLSLQEQCLVEDESFGKSALKSIFHDNQVLVVLDDVVSADQLLERIGIQRKGFTEGSRIITTSRDKDILLSFAPDELYEAKELLESEALELFSYHAFRRKEPTKELWSLSNEIVSLTGRLPLAIEVFGSVLLDKRTKGEWKNSLEKLKRIRPSNLQDVLKLSYDELDDKHKCIFLDISCLFVQVGMKRVDAIDILNGCGFTAEDAVQLFMKKSLLKITRDDILWMHDQLRDMGRQIVIEQGVDNLGNRSRLWNYPDVLSVLKNNTGTDKVRGIILDTGRKRLMVTSRTSSLLNVWRNFNSYGSEDSDINKRSFQTLAKLKLLQISGVEFIGDLNYIHMPAELRWLKWKECPWKSLPSSLPQDIRVLDLSESKLECLWSSKWMFCSNNQVKNLMVLNLSNSYHLTSIPDLSGLCSVRKLILEGCIKLNKIHESLRHMTSLIHLNLRRCTTLTELPRDISGLKCLEELILSDCSALGRLPCDFESQESLRELHLDHTAVSELPNLLKLTSLELMSLNHCIKLKHLPEDIGTMCSLKTLSLSGSSIQELPDSIGLLENLGQLRLEHCSLLKGIPNSIGKLMSLSQLRLTRTYISELPDSCCSLPNLKSLSVANCSLHTLPASIGGLSSIVELHLDGSKIQKLPDEIGSLKVIQTLQMRNCTSLRALPESFGNLFSLSVLNLEDTSIIELPESIGSLENLIRLRLNRCKSLRVLPCTFGGLKSLCHLYMEETGITELPESIGMLSKLEILKMKRKPHLGGDDDTHHKSPQLAELPTSFGNLSLLQEFDARAWNICGRIPENFKMLSSMETLNLGHNSFHSLPSDLRCLLVLKNLLVPHCQNLELLPPLPSGLIVLNAANCSTLSCIPDLSNLAKLEELEFTGCNKLQDVTGLEHLRSLRRVYMAGCDASGSAIRKRLGKAAYEKLSYLAIPGSQIPNWFSEDPVVFSSCVNSALESVMIGVVLSVKTGSMDDTLPYSPLTAVQVKIWRRGDGKPIFSKVLSLKAMPKTYEDQLYLCRFKGFHPLVSLLEDNDKVEVGLIPARAGSIELRRCGIYLVYENDDGYVGNEDLLEYEEQSVSQKLARFFHSMDKCLLP